MASLRKSLLQSKALPQWCHHISTVGQLIPVCNKKTKWILIYLIGEMQLFVTAGFVTCHSNPMGNDIAKLSFHLCIPIFNIDGLVCWFCLLNSLVLMMMECIGSCTVEEFEGSPYLTELYQQLFCVACGLVTKQQLQDLQAGIQLSPQKGTAFIH